MINFFDKLIIFINGNAEKIISKYILTFNLFLIHLLLIKEKNYGK